MAWMRLPTLDVRSRLSASRRPERAREPDGGDERALIMFPHVYEHLCDAIASKTGAAAQGTHGSPFCSATPTRIAVRQPLYSYRGDAGQRRGL